MTTKTIRIEPNAAQDYATWKAFADGQQFDQLFQTHAIAVRFIRDAGGTDRRRITPTCSQWIMPDGWTATLEDGEDDRVVTFAPPREPTPRAIDPAYALAVGAELADAAAACTTPGKAAHLRAIAACLREGIAAQARGALADAQRRAEGDR